MKRQRASNPFLIWNELAWKSAEMLASSAQVIHHRTQRMMVAGPSPNARDRKEFTRMGQEKVEAAALSAQAMAWEAASFPQQFGMQLFQNMVATSADMMRMATRISTGSANTLPAQMARQAMTDSAALGLQMTNSTARLLTSGLRPVHSRATANAKRLGKFKWRPAKR